MKDLEVIEAQLSRTMSFFPRIDAKVAGLFAINSTILTVSALNVETGDLVRWQVAVPGTLLLLLLIASFTHLYRCHFPNLDGGEGSLIYFKAISTRTEVTYKAEYEAASDANYRGDLLGQIWRNSCILAQKYDALAKAINLTLAALLPFVIFLVVTAIEHTRLPVVSV